jgi:Domain of unknown function (DUF4190)
VSFQPIVGILAVIFGFIGIREVKNSASQVTGRDMAIGGVVMGFISVALMVLFIGLYILFLLAITPGFIGFAEFAA